jgi:hypothetical protein
MYTWPGGGVKAGFPLFGWIEVFIGSRPTREPTEEMQFEKRKG